MNKYLQVAIIFILALGIYLYLRSPDAISTLSNPTNTETAAVNSQQDDIDEHEKVFSNEDLKTEQSPLVNNSTHEEVVAENNEPQEQSNAVSYVVRDGLAVVDEDIVLGVPRSARPGGRIEIETINPWVNGIIPFHIQADLPNKERVIQALAQFVDTPIQFIPYTDQEDVLVFDGSSNACRSYLGRVGGKQPLWIGPNCSVREIVHEIMHAIGFVHEQNRNDRDQFVQVVWNNIQNNYLHNFEVFPSSLMAFSASAPFDFESIMLYQPTAFSNNGQPTIKSIVEGKSISPSNSLSSTDLLRLRKIYQH